MKKFLLFITLCIISSVTPAAGIDWMALHAQVLQTVKGNAENATSTKQALDTALPQLTTDLQQSKIIQTNAIRTYVAAYAIWHDPRYLQAAATLTRTLLTQTRNPQGAFYSNGHIYARENGLAILALVDMYRATGQISYLNDAKRTLLWMNIHRRIPNGGFSHEATDYATPQVEDTLAMGRACLALYQATADRHYLTMAEQAADFIQQHFQYAKTAEDNVELAYFARLLFHYTHRTLYLTLSEQALDHISAAPLAAVVKQELADDPLHITIVGRKNDHQALLLYRAAFAYPVDYKRLEWWDKNAEPPLATDIVFPTLPHAAAFICVNHRCSLPITQPQKMTPLIQHLSQTTQTSPRTMATDTRLRNLMHANVWLFMFGFFGLGLLLAFTPCVLPMLPILAGAIVGQGAKITLKKAFQLSVVYVVSMATTYALAGLLTGYLGHYIQSDLQNSWVIVAFSLLFVLLALSLFGLYELELPKRLRHHITFVSNRQMGGSYFGVAVMGCLSTLIASPCITPPLIGVLSYIADSGNAVLGGIALFVMGLGMGTPLIIMGTLGGKLLPKAGPWLDDVRIFFGFMLLSVAIWMLDRIMPKHIILTLWVLLAFTVTIYLGFFTNLAATRFGKISKAASIMVIVYGLILLTSSFIATSSSTRESRDITAVPYFQRVNNITELRTELAKAKTAGKPVLIDFYADWCVACRHMKLYRFSNEVIKPLLTQFQLIEVDLTHTTPGTTAILTYFHVIAPPTLLFFNRHGDLSALRIYGDIHTEALRDSLQQIVTGSIQ